MTAAVSDIAPRSPLTRERVLRAAVALADEGGIEAVSMRRLGQELGVEAMALYRHVRNKEELVDGVIDLVVGEIVPPKFDGDWRSAMRKLSLAARGVMLRHAWAPSLIVDRPTIGPATLGHIERVMAILRDGGFSLDMAHHALHVLGSRILGFTQDPFNDAADPRPDPETAAGVARVLAISYPNLGELALDAAHSGALRGCDDDFEFAFSLDLILDGLERRRTAD